MTLENVRLFGALVWLWVFPLSTSLQHSVNSTSSWECQKSLDLLKEILGALDKALDFMDSQEKVNIDGYYCIRMVDGQLYSFLTKKDDSAFFKTSAGRNLLSQLQKIRLKAKTISDEGTLKVKALEPEYFLTVGNVLTEIRWSLGYPAKNLPKRKYEVAKPEDRIPFDPDLSDDCLSNLVGSSDNVSSRCTISSQCWTYMTEGNHAEYSLTHQIMYLQNAQMMGCEPHMANLTSAREQANVTTIQEEMCGRVFTETSDLALQGYPIRHQDLFLEQVALCGILGYRDFLNETWLKEILSWQEFNGCYSIQPDRAASNPRRVKREEIELEGNCGSHKTGVALGALVASSRLLLDSIIDGSTYI